jgi:hypothetical protein
MKSINTTKKKYSQAGLKATLGNVVPMVTNVNDLLDEAIADCADDINGKQEVLDGLKALKTVFKSIKPGSKEEKALLSLIGY